VPLAVLAPVRLDVGTAAAGEEAPAGVGPAQEEAHNLVRAEDTGEAVEDGGLEVLEEGGELLPGTTSNNMCCPISFVNTFR
jgi:hypothetical protein